MFKVPLRNRRTSNVERFGYLAVRQHTVDRQGYGLGNDFGTPQTPFPRASLPREKVSSSTLTMPELSRTRSGNSFFCTRVIFQLPSCHVSPFFFTNDE